MTDPTRCPPAEQLENLIRGRIEVELAESIAQHLESCDRCNDTIARMDSRDATMLAVLRQSNIKFEFQSEQALAIAQDRVRQIAHDASRVDALSCAQTVSLDGPLQDTGFSSSIPNNALAHGLRPAELDDEIGRLGCYRILEVLGGGGMGMVYRAEDPWICREVAIKTIKPEVASGNTTERFLREARCAAAIDHENIVKIYEVGEDRDVPFIVMPMLKGESLKHAVNRKQRLDQDEILRIAWDVASGLAAAHQCGLVHRDIKPDNLWIEADTRRVKILDFGLARSNENDGGLTRTGVVLGTPKYMSPEQANGDTVDHRSDLFSLGSVLYELVTGEQPFQGKSLPAILIAVSAADVVPIHQAAPEIDTDLALLITNLLRKTPANRPQSAVEVVAAIVDIQQRHALGQYKTHRLSQSPDELPAPNSVRPHQVWMISVCGAILGISLVATLIALRGSMNPSPQISPAARLISNDWSWTLPVRLGSPVNTRLLEVSPEISHDGLELLFSRQDNLYIATRSSVRETFKEIIAIDAVNSSHSEDAATLSYDRLTLVFASQRMGYSLWTATRKTIDDEFEDVYELWPTLREAGNNFQTPHLTRDGLTLYLTFNGDIAVSHRNSTSEQFASPIKLGGSVNSDQWESHPTLTDDQSILIYRSHRKHGLGDGDLWLCSRIDGDRFSDPVNLGPEINTSRLESGPSLSSDGETLYFMSDRDSTLNFDIWVSHRISGSEKVVDHSPP